MRRRAVKKVKKRFLQDGTLSPAFAERVSNEVDVYHTLGRSLAVAHLYGAYEDDSHIFMVQDCPFKHCTQLLSPPSCAHGFCPLLATCA